ncbi:MAG TPA: peptidyl-prolyl cis-trans isomerase [Polyangiaceae bacterium]|nr:peptidyl-prolyl cis-trans isomerase [Polyangiaceae bacterium]
MTRRRAVGIAIFVATMLACGAHGDRVETTRPLGGDVARAGALGIPGALVADVARSRAVPPAQALDALVEDALLAREAVARGLDRAPEVSWASTVALARVVPGRILDAARAQGPASDDELAILSVIHAVVQRSNRLSEPRALAIADALESAVGGATSAADFESRANGVPHSSAAVVVEPIDSFGADGRMPDGGQLDSAFVAAAFALRKKGDTSPVVETAFGWHVIRLVDRILPDPETLARRRRDLAGAVIQARARAELQRVLRDLKRTVRLEVAAGADDLMTEAARAREP